jgi:hypothetical protein
VSCGSVYDEVFFTDEAKVIAVACSRSPRTNLGWTPFKSRSVARVPESLEADVG